MFLALQGVRSPALDRLVIGITTLGNVAVALPVMAATMLALLWARRWADALATLACVAPIAMGNLLKMAVVRPRPDQVMPEQVMSEVAYSGMSFPSGHALFALLFGGLLMVLIEEMVRPLAVRRGLQVTVAVLAVAIGASRVYMGVHWPSDVVGGYLFAAISLVVILAGRKTLADKGW